MKKPEQEKPETQIWRLRQNRQHTIMAQSANGTTQKIRNQLQFLDNKKWKLFSTRRLELIDRFKLFEKKASEQDCNIERIANILRTEFDYSIEHQLDFEKLVTAAVQSVRRNRKRSKNLTGGSSSETEEKDKKTATAPSSPSLTRIKTETHSNGGFSIPSASSNTNNKVNKIARSPSSSFSSGFAKPEHNKGSVTVSVAVSQRNGSSSNGGSDSESNKMSSPSLSPANSPLQLTRHSPLLHQTSLQGFPSAAISINIDSKNPMLPIDSNKGNAQPGASGNRIILPPLQNLSNSKRKKTKQPKIKATPKIEGSNIEIVKSIIADIVFQKVSLKNQLMSSSNANPLSKFSTPTNNANSSNSDLSLEFFALSSQNRDLLPIALKQPNNRNATTATTLTPTSSVQGSVPPKKASYNCPFFLKSKILIQINNSKTCHDICTKQGSYKDLYENILEMGNLGYRSCLLFIFERFHGMNTAMISYLKDKLLTGDRAEERLIQVVENLFESATLRDLRNLKSEFKIDLFKLCIGSLIKDFGFDPVIYPLGEIFQDFILKELSPFINSAPIGEQLNQSLTAEDSNSSYKLSDNNSNFAHNMIVSTAPLDPTMANNSIYRTVVIKKGDKRQDFTFYPLSNGTPTISEILANCSFLFGLTNNPVVTSSSSKTKVDHLLQKGKERNIHDNAPLAKKNVGICGRYGLYHDNQILKSDVELSTLLTNFGMDSREIVLDIKECATSNTTTSSRSPSVSPHSGVVAHDGLSILSSAAFVSSNQSK